MPLPHKETALSFLAGVIAALIDGTPASVAEGSMARAEDPEGKLGKKAAPQEAAPR